MTGDDVEPDEASTTSPDADTQLLFVRPLYTPGSQLELPWVFTVILNVTKLITKKQFSLFLIVVEFQ